MKEELELDFDDRINQKGSVFPRDQITKKNQIRLTEENRKSKFDNNNNVQRNSNSNMINRNTEKTSLKNIKLDSKTKTAIQIVRYDGRHKFEFNDEAEEVKKL